MSTLREKLDEVRAELEQLRAREAERLDRSGLRDELEALTADNQRLSDQRRQVAHELEVAQTALENTQQQRAMLELQLKGARARVAKLSQVLRGRR